MHAMLSQTDIDGANNPRNNFNPLASPPQALKDLFKAWRAKPESPVGKLCDSLDELAAQDFCTISSRQLLNVFNDFCIPNAVDINLEGACEKAGRLYNVEGLPGLMVAPSLFPPILQSQLLSRLLHRDLSNPLHTTNLHLHHDITYPDAQASFFSVDPASIPFISKDGNEQKDLDVRRAMTKKLRWMTLGGQYNWTNKEYPAGEPLRFPSDVARLIGGIFTNMEPQAAIVNLYSPGDTLSMHRDVSEEVDRGLVSISLGCEAIFVIALEDEETGEIKSAILRLRSGDALYMSGASRFAWHGVPRIVPGTCPDYLEDWPGTEFPQWKGWMQEKRINLNVRQMREGTSILRPLDLIST